MDNSKMSDQNKKLVQALRDSKIILERAHGYLVHEEVKKIPFSVRSDQAGDLCSVLAAYIGELLNELRD